MRRLIIAALFLFAASTQALAEDEPRPLGGPFMLMDHFGEIKNNNNFLGDFMLMYFGYTYCPDVCPTGLQAMADALDMLPESQLKYLHPMFISVDPDRDTVRVLREYTSHFHPKLIGYTGSKEMIARVAENYKVRFEKVVEDPNDTENYLVDHSASTVLIGPDGTFRKKFIHGTSPEDMAKALKKLLPTKD